MIWKSLCNLYTLGSSKHTFCVNINIIYPMERTSSNFLKEVSLLFLLSHYLSEVQSRLVRHATVTDTSK